ncbi:MAG: putative dehydrogenase [Acidobacteria bacterium]|nr:putative dehydrogenase [Acidobacteriota bacterium]
MEHATSVDRREFLKAAAAAAGVTIVPRTVLAGSGRPAPSDTLHVAVIGTGGQGLVNMRALFQEDDVRVVAIADPNEESDYRQWYYGGTAGRLPAQKLIDDTYRAKDGTAFKPCQAYVDFREMLEKEKGIDAVLVATPDHLHAYVSLAVLQLKKHLYCEKPLCRTIHEVQKVVAAAKEAGVATQMGNYGHSGEGLRLFCEWIWDGAIGPVREVHAWAVFPPLNVFKERPAETVPTPPGLNWDLWLGPAAERPYHPAYAPVTWRPWHDFGTGMMGDFACHHLDPAFTALKLDYPDSIEAVHYGAGKETYPFAAMIYLDFPARGDQPPVKVTWYDNGLKPPTPEELGDARKLGAHGILMVGDKGKILGGGWAQSPRLIPEGAMQAYKRPPRTLRRVKGHHRDWIDACKGGEPSSANFEAVGKMVEVVLMGAIAERVGDKLRWDRASGRFSNSALANDLITPVCRKGWEV